MTPVEIPNRSLFKAAEVCEIAGVPTYVLRTWEAEFPDLGVAKGGGRVYRRADLERVLQIKQLLFVEGLTLAGARRRLGDEPAAAEASGPPIDELLGRDARERIQQVRQGLRDVLRILTRETGGRDEFALRSAAQPRKSGARPPARRKSPAKSGKIARRTKH
jgi:DNA-binding transcriptional MerR regulator